MTAAFTGAIHPSAVIEDGAVIGDEVRIGPFCTVGAEVRLGAGVVLKSHVVVAGRTEIGPETVIFPGAVIGEIPQDLKFRGEATRLVVGARNRIREGVTMNTGTQGGGGVTSVGDDCLFMTGAHVAHDARVGNRVIVANQGAIAGHCMIEDDVIIGGLSGIHQFVRIGRGAIIGAVTMVAQDVIPYGLVQAPRGALDGLNLVGLKRRGVPRADITALRAAYQMLVQGEGAFLDRARRLADDTDSDLVREVAAFILSGSGRQFLTPGLMLALVAGEGRLPRLLYETARPAVVCEMEGHPSGLVDPLLFRIETLGTLIAELVGRGVTEVCFAGRVRRPPLDPARVDAATRPLVPRIMAALGQGDDGALRVLIALFEEAAIAVRGAHEILPALLPPQGVPTRAAPGPRDRSDADRAATIHAALGQADLGQACIVAGGQALAVETLGGTDRMLAAVAQNRPPSQPGGLLFKAPKPGQDRRIDLPAIGPDTAAATQAAGLSGIVVEAGGVLVLGLDETVSACDAAGLFLWVRER